MSTDALPPPGPPDDLDAEALRRLRLTEIEALVRDLPDGAERVWALLEQDPRVGVRRLAVRQRRQRLRKQAEGSRLQGLLAIERGLWRQQLTRVAGVDEVGRGCLAGPVVAAAVVLPPGWTVPGLDDSKKLTPEHRQRLRQEIEQGAAGIGIGWVAAEEIDRTDILRATLQAMRLAIAQLPQPPEHVLVDGGHLPASPFPETAVADGDARSLSIAAASVVAKVERDRAMVEWDSQYPRYGFARHKGYGTEEHLAALRAHGPCPLHRRSFAPVRELAGEPGADGYRGFAAALEASADTQQLEAVARRIRAGRQALGPAELEALRRLYRRQRQRWADPGRRAEDLAARYLEERGYAILERGYRGAGGEIDLVARQGDCLVFVEVKSAWGRRLGRPEERVDAAKQGHLVRAARQYLLAHDLKGDCRFDVVVIEGSPEGPRFTHLVSAFQASA